MSFDIVILKPSGSSALVPSLDQIAEVDPLGTPDEVKGCCDAALAAIDWSSPRFGLYEAPEGFAIEITIPKEGIPQSLHFTLHFGSKWETAGSQAFDFAMKRLYELHGWQSFAVSDSSSLLLGSEV